MRGTSNESVPEMDIKGKLAEQNLDMSPILWVWKTFDVAIMIHFQCRMWWNFMSAWCLLCCLFPGIFFGSFPGILGIPSDMSFWTNSGNLRFPTQMSKLICIKILGLAFSKDTYPFKNPLSKPPKSYLSSWNILKSNKVQRLIISNYIASYPLNLRFTMPFSDFLLALWYDGHWWTDGHPLALCILRKLPPYPVMFQFLNHMEVSWKMAQKWMVHDGNCQKIRIIWGLIGNLHIPAESDSSNSMDGRKWQETPHGFLYIFAFYHPSTTNNDHNFPVSVRPRRHRHAREHLAVLRRCLLWHTQRRQDVEEWCDVASNAHLKTATFTCWLIKMW